MKGFRMNNRLYWTCLWPGLPELWWRGRLAALPTAIAFALAFNGLLIARFVYPEWLTFGWVRVAGWVGVIAWFYCTLKNVRALPGLIHPRRVSDKPDRFADAHFAFLRSDWPRAEILLKDCLAIEERDPPTLLLLASVYRHKGQMELARACIDTLRITEAADRWWLEVDAEEKRWLRDQEYRLADAKVSHPETVSGQGNSPAERASIAA
jgi:hypothetical protein